VSIPALIVMLVGLVLFGAGLVLPFVAGRLSGRAAAAPPALALPDAPSIDVVIAAYLESSVIGETIDSLTRQLAARPGRSTITVVASDPQTADVAEAHGARVLRGEPHGKPAAVNEGVLSSVAEIIVLSDANCRIAPDEWPTLMLTELTTANLVSASKTEAGGGEGAYWKYEAAVKSSGEGTTETLSVVGEFLAFRRADFVAIPEHVLTDDLYLATDFALRGRVVRASGSILTVEPPTHGAEQVERRIRISAGQWAEALPRWRELARIPAGRQFLAHKGYRMSFGALGFWIAVVGFALLVWPWTTIIAVVAVVGGWLIYTRIPNAPSILRLGATVVALQAITFLGLARAIRRRLSRSPQRGWKKVAR
jgi:hypothetical protein